MSRQEENTAKPYPLFPPAHGLFKPFRKYNPADGRGRATSCKLWRVSKNLLSIIEGTQALTGQDNTGTGSHVKMIATYKMSTGVIKLFYVYGDGLRVFPLDNSSAESVVAAAITSSDPDRRFGWVRFRNRILIGTYNNGLWWLDPDASTARKAGVTVPTAPTLTDTAAGVLTAGTYGGKVTFVNDQGHEGNPSAAGTVTLGASRQIAWTSIAVGPTGTSSRKLYRTTDDGSTYLFLATIADNTTTTYADNTPDASLGAAVDTDNTIPTENIRQVAASKSRVALMDVDGLTLWFSKIDATTGQPNWEAYTSLLSLDLAFSGGEDKGKAVCYGKGDFYVFGGLSVARIVGDIAAGVTVEQALQTEGLFSPFAFDLVGEDGIVFINNLKQLKFWDFVNPPRNVGAGVQALLDTMVSGAGLDGPDVVYDPLWNCAYINFGTTASVANDSGLAIDLDSGEIFDPNYAYSVSYFCPFMRGLYGSRFDVAAITGWYAAQTETAVYSAWPLKTLADNKYELFQWSPSPGDDIDFLQLQLLCRGQEMSGTVPPLLVVEYALDGAGRFKKHILEFRKRQIIDEDGDSPIVFAAEVGIYRVAKYLTVRLTVPNNAASRANGFEVFGINAVAMVLGPSNDSHKTLGEGDRRIYH